MRVSTSAIVLAAVTASPSLSQENVKATGQTEVATPTNPWSYTFTPFLWGSGLTGSVSKGPLSGDVNTGFKTVVDNMVVGAMLDFRARRGAWELGSDLVYAKLSASKAGPIAGTDLAVNVKLTILELDAKYYFWDNFFGYAGGRYIDVEAGLAIGAPISASASSVNDWVDPIVGVGFSIPLSEKWSVSGKGDIGGFGVGSDFAWQAQAYAQYEASDLIRLMFGYRHLEFDYTSSSGANLNLAISGPVFGLRFKF